MASSMAYDRWAATDPAMRYSDLAHEVAVEVAGLIGCPVAVLETATDPSGYSLASALLSQMAPQCGSVRGTIRQRAGTDCTSRTRIRLQWGWFGPELEHHVKTKYPWLASERRTGKRRTKLHHRVTVNPIHDIHISVGHLTFLRAFFSHPATDGFRTVVGLNNLLNMRVKRS